MKTWRDAVIEAIQRFTEDKNSYIFSRQEIIRNQLPLITREVESEGVTPAQTLSRVLQELRDDNLIEFIDNSGNYVFLANNLDVEKEDLPEKAIDEAIKNRRLIFNDIHTDEKAVIRRQRIGQNRLRHWTLLNYNFRCALCDVSDKNLLVASHLARWADCKEGRGDLTNIVCLCRWHDPLLEFGLISFTDDYKIIKKTSKYKMIQNLLNYTNTFIKPMNVPLSPYYLEIHRQRTGFA